MRPWTSTDWLVLLMSLVCFIVTILLVAADALNGGL